VLDLGRWKRSSDPRPVTLERCPDGATHLMLVAKPHAAKSGVQARDGHFGREAVASRAALLPVRKVEGPAGVLPGFAALAIAPAPENIEVKRRSQIDLDPRYPMALVTVPATLEAGPQLFPRPRR
jgi:DNA primase